MTANVGCWLGLVASVSASVFALADAFPPSWKPAILLCGAIGAGVSGWLAKSPLAHDAGAADSVKPRP